MNETLLPFAGAKLLWRSGKPEQSSRPPGLRMPESGLNGIWWFKRLRQLGFV
jgi:hypothetical protein